LDDSQQIELFVGQAILYYEPIDCCNSLQKRRKKTNEKTNKQKKRWNWVSTPILLKPNLNEFDQFSIVICKELTDSI